MRRDLEERMVKVLEEQSKAIDAMLKMLKELTDLLVKREKQ